MRALTCLAPWSPTLARDCSAPSDESPPRLQLPSGVLDGCGGGRGNSLTLLGPEHQKLSHVASDADPAPVPLSTRGCARHGCARRSFGHCAIRVGPGDVSEPSLGA